MPKQTYDLVPQNTPAEAGPPDLDTIRAHMNEAPVQVGGTQSQEPGTTAYHYSRWPASEGQNGSVIAEQRRPDTEVVKDVRDADFELSMPEGITEFSEVHTFATAMDSNLGDALSSLGFTAHIERPNETSTVVSASYPSVEDFNRTLAATGNGDTRVRMLDASGMSGDDLAEEVVEACANGTILLTDERDMLTQAPVVGLLPPSVHQALRQKAQAAVEGVDPYAINEVHNIISGLTVRITGETISKGLLPETGIVPTPQEELGRELAMKLRMFDESGLPADGLKLAEDTIQHVANFNKPALNP